MRLDAAGKESVPTLYDISGSANFFNKTDFGITTHRDRINDIVEVHIQKVKFKHLGTTGSALFKYNFNNGRYVPYTEGQPVKWDNSNHLDAGKEKDYLTSLFDFNEQKDDTPPF